MTCYSLLTIFVVFVIFCDGVAFAQNSSFFFPANASTIWSNNDSIPHTYQFSDGSMVRFVLLFGGDLYNIVPILGFGCGFFCHSSVGNSCHLAIVAVEVTSLIFTGMAPQVVWSANRDNPVGEDAMLEFSQDGDLVLKDPSGVEVWSSGTGGLSVIGTNITSVGNLVLFNNTNGKVWQSFDHPTDTLLSDQVLRAGQRLTSSISSTNLHQGLFFLSIINNSVVALVVQADMATSYLSLIPSYKKSTTAPDSLRYGSFEDGQMNFSYEYGNNTYPDPLEETTELASAVFLRLDPDGDLRIYGWLPRNGCRVLYDFMDRRDACQLPLKCVGYGLCTGGQCSCPKALDGVNYLKPVESQSLDLGCSQIRPSLFQITTFEQFQLVDFGNLSYFSNMDLEAVAHGIQNLRDCKDACFRNSSCKAAFFVFKSNVSDGLCYLPSEILSIRGDPISGTRNHSSLHLKLRIFSLSSPTQEAKIRTLSSIAIVAVIFISASMCYVLLRKRRQAEGKEEYYFEQFPGMPARFSYKDLCVATGEFSQILGRGGFGQVFRGVLMDGRMVAVKRLDYDSQGIDGFLAEVKTIGSIHHINLVQLIGFCAEKSRKLLVYEYMSNGSLDKWIFCERKKHDLDWKTRQKIILDVAKGLTYLHEDCREKIAHFDVKPHNILLDAKFNAKISDFGLAKLINRDQSQVTTIVRGTIGYIAPEWQHSDHITVKADIYSFGIVLIEVVCGRKNLDYSKDESCIHLLSLLQKKAEMNQLIDIVDKQREDEEYYGEEALRMLKVAVCCLNVDYKKRPSMSTVVKVLEGVMELESPVSYPLLQTMVPSTNYVAVSSPPS